MKYENIQKFHSKLSKTSKYSKHNKEVLDEYFRWASRECTDIKDTGLEKYASRWYTLGDLVNFKLDEATRENTSNLIADINDGKTKKKLQEE